MPFQLVPTRNSSTAPRRVVKGGRTYLVAPLTMLLPGVLNGSRGPLYYPREEVAANPLGWDRMPIVLRHPRDVDGSPVAASDPDVVRRYGMGVVRNPRVTRNAGALAADGWFDEAATRRLAPQVYKAILGGQPVELSTGLYTRNTPGAGVDPRTGRRYEYTATNYRPDHLAVLPDEVGACSVADGCGVNVVSNARGKKGSNCGVGPGGFQQGNTCASGGGKGPDGKYAPGGQGVGGRTDRGEGLHEGLIRLAEKQAAQARKRGQKKLAKMYEDHAESLKKKHRPTGNARKKRKGKPSAGLDMSPDKACKILEDGTVHGKKLTKAQRGMFGAKCGQRVGNSRPCRCGKCPRPTANSDQASGFQARSQVTGRFKYPGGASGKGPEHLAAQRGAFRPDADDLVRGGQLHAELGDARDHRRLPGWAGDRRKWRAAMTKAAEGGYSGRDYWDATAHIYRRTGGVIRPTDSGGPTATTNLGGRMATRKQKLVNWLTTNCACLSGKAKQLEALDEETLNDLRLREIEVQKNAVVANAAAAGIAVPGTPLVQVWNEEAEAFELQDDEGNVVESLELNDDDDDPDATDDQDTDDDDEEPQPKVRRKGGKEQVVGNSIVRDRGKAKITLNDLPDEVREVVETGIKVGQRYRAGLIAKLVANSKAAGDKKRSAALAAGLAKKKTNDLEMMASFIQDEIPTGNRRGKKAKDEDDDGEDDPVVNFFGAAGGAAGGGKRRKAGAVDPDDVMVLPTLNLGSGYGKQAKKIKAGTAEDN